MRTLNGSCRVGFLVVVLVLPWSAGGGCGSGKEATDAGLVEDGAGRSETGEGPDGTEADASGAEGRMDLHVPDGGPSDAAADSAVIHLPESPVVPVLLSDSLPAAVEGLAFDGKGSLFLGGVDGKVYRMDAAGNVEAYVDLLPVEEGVLAGTAGLAHGPDGALYVCRYSANRVERVLLGDSPEVEVFLDGIVAPNTLLFDSEGSLWFTSSGSQTDGEPGYVGRLDAEGHPEVVVPDVVYANGLAFSPDGAVLYFTSTDPGSLLKAELDDQGAPGPVEVVCDSKDLAVADGLAVSPDGTVFVAGFGTGTLYAWTGNDLVGVAKDPSGLGIVGIASLAWGQGEGFSPTALYVTNLVKPVLAVVELGL